MLKTPISIVDFTKIEYNTFWGATFSYGSLDMSEEFYYRDWLLRTKFSLKQYIYSFNWEVCVD